MLKIDSRRNGLTTTLALAGRLDTASLPHLSMAVAGERVARREVVLELRNVLTVDRDALRALIEFRRAGVALTELPAFIEEWLEAETKAPWTVVVLLLCAALAATTRCISDSFPALRQAIEPPSSLRVAPRGRENGSSQSIPPIAADPLPPHTHPPVPEVAAEPGRDTTTT